MGVVGVEGVVMNTWRHVAEKSTSETDTETNSDKFHCESCRNTLVQLQATVKPQNEEK
jgi:hypothetical protein